MVASGDITLDGNNIDAEDGITVQTTEFHIDGFEIARFSDDGLDIQGDLLDSRTIEIVNVTSRLNGENNIQILSNPNPDTVELQNVEAKDNGGASSVYIRAETVVVDNADISGSEDNGLDVGAGSEGNVTIRDTVVSDAGEDTGFGDDGPEKGIHIRDAQSVTIENTEVTNSLDDGIHLSSTDAIAGGQTVELTNVTALSNEGDGGQIGGTGDSDQGIINSSEFIENSDDGLDFRTDNTTVRRSVIKDNIDDGVRFAGGITEGIINISEILNNGGAEARNEEEAVLVDATNNWWGDPTGPSEDEIVGNVLTEDPLDAPPNTLVADAGSPQTVEAGTTVTLDGTGSSNPSDGSLSYSWTQTGGPDVSLADPETATPEFTAPDVDSETDLTFELTVDNGQTTDTDNTTMTVKPAAASFEVSELEADNTDFEGNAGTSAVAGTDNLIITATVTNADDFEDTQTVEFQFGGQVAASEEVTLAGGESTTVQFDVTAPDVEAGNYTHGMFTDDDSQTAEIEILPAVSLLDDPARDTSGDGLLNDVNGDGMFDIFDVRALFVNLDEPAVQDYAEFYDFDESGGDVDIFDVRALFNRL